MHNKRASLLCLLATLVLRAKAYGFSIDNSPTQCGTLNISITGSGGTPPYRLGIIPWGTSPLSGGLEVRHILDVPFNDSSHVSFNLPYPQNSQFVAVVSDNNGAKSNFASGGVTVPVSVLGTGSGDCLPKTQVAPDFPFSTDPIGVVTTCQAGFFTWDASSVNGDVTLWGVIPGGQGFIINGTSTNDQGKAAISWAPTVSTGTGLLVVAGDNRGFGSGGSFQGFLQPGNGTTSCLDSSSPMSTPGSPAGGSYPTDSSGDKSSGGGGGGGGSGGKSDVGAIVGGVIGGVAGVAILGVVVFLLLRRRKHKRRAAGEPVDLLEGREGERVGDATVPQQYLPEPYHIPPSTSNEMSETASAHHLTARDRRVSGLSMTTQTRPSTEETSAVPGGSTTRTSNKSAAGPPQLRAMNIIQHEDAGPSEGPKEEEQEAETVELPPAYTNIRTK